MERKASLTIHPMPVGAQVIGLPPGTSFDGQVKEELYRAWMEHGLLIFRGIDSTERHLALSQCFGELEIHPYPEARAEDNQYLIELGGRKRRRAIVFDETEVRINRVAWHRDTAYTPDICKGAVLRMLETPLTGGETLIADTAKAYDDLSEQMKSRLDGLEFKTTFCIDPVHAQGRPGTFWKTARPATADEDPFAPASEVISSSTAHRYPPVVHPAVLTHPESGRKGIFISPTYVESFLGMNRSESDELLAYLTAHMLSPKYIYRHRWSRDEAMLWDNRRCIHAALGNPIDQPRRALRTTLAGAVRTGRYFEDGAKQTGPLLVD